MDVSKGRNFNDNFVPTRVLSVIGVYEERSGTGPAGVLEKKKKTSYLFTFGRCTYFLACSSNVLWDLTISKVGGCA